jgi:hypothetical protein
MTKYEQVQYIVYTHLTKNCLYKEIDMYPCKLLIGFDFSTGEKRNLHDGQMEANECLELGFWSKRET